MPWCPICKNEYVEGITVCADCGTKLVESIDENIDEAQEIDINIFSQENEPNISVEELAELEAESSHESSREWSRPYQDSAQKAEENKTSAYTLLLVGVVGLAASLLVLAGVIPLYQNAGITKYLVCGVMGALFLLFIIFGIVSMKSFKIWSVKAESESNLVQEMTKWCDANLSASQIDEGLFEAEDVPEEQKYFKRIDKMKGIIQDKFMNLEEDFVDHFVDDYYQNLF